MENWVDEFFNSENWYYTYIDKIGNDMFQKEFDVAGDFSEGLAVAEVDGKTGCIDKSGNFVFYHEGVNVFHTFSEEMLCFGMGEDEQFKMDFLDKDGNEVIPAMYYSVYNNGFVNGLALVAENHEKTKWSYIDKNNYIIFTFYVNSLDDLEFY